MLSKLWLSTSGWAIAEAMPSMQLQELPRQTMARAIVWEQFAPSEEDWLQVQATAKATMEAKAALEQQMEGAEAKTESEMLRCTPPSSQAVHDRHPHPSDPLLFTDHVAHKRTTTTAQTTTTARTRSLCG